MAMNCYWIGSNDTNAYFGLAQALEIIKTPTLCILTWKKAPLNSEGLTASKKQGVRLWGKSNILWV